LSEQVLGSVIGEASVDGDELLVQNGGAEEASQLLLFGRVAGKGEAVAKTGKDEAGDAAVDRLKEGQLSLFEGEEEVALANFDAIRGGDREDVLRIKAQGV